MRDINGDHAGGESYKENGRYRKKRDRDNIESRHTDAGAQSRADESADGSAADMLASGAEHFDHIEGLGVTADSVQDHRQRDQRGKRKDHTQGGIIVVDILFPEYRNRYHNGGNGVGSARKQSQQRGLDKAAEKSGKRGREQAEQNEDRR